MGCTMIEDVCGGVDNNRGGRDQRGKEANVSKRWDGMGLEGMRKERVFSCFVFRLLVR